MVSIPILAPFKTHNYLYFLVITLLNTCNFKAENRKQTDFEVDTNYAIVYNVWVNENEDDYEVFVMDTDGSKKRNITNLKGVEWSYSSYDHQLYFISDKDTCVRCFFLYQTDYQGMVHRKIFNVRLADSWMSFRNQGTEIILKPHPSVDSGFYIIDLQGKLRHHVTAPLSFMSDPLFVDEGKKIAFRGGTKPSKKDTGYQEAIYLMDVNGSGLVQLTHYPTSDTTAQWFAYRAGPPRVHPTEKFISYTSFQNGKYSLFGITMDGKKQWKLTDSKKNEVYHDWSPDGKWLVTDLSDVDGSHYDIGLLNWDAKIYSILTDTTYHYQLSPNFILKTKKKSNP